MTSTSEIEMKGTTTNNPISSNIEKKYVDHIFKLLFAASNGNMKELTELRESYPDEDLNVADYDGRTALHLASAEGHHEIVKFLVAEFQKVYHDTDGVNRCLNPLDRFHQTPLDEAVKNGHRQIAIFLRDSGCKTYRDHGVDLIKASFLGDLNTMRTLLENGVDPNYQDYDKRSALHVAAGQQNTAAVELLLRFGANPNSEDIWEGTAILDAKRTLNRTKGDSVLQQLLNAMGTNKPQTPIWSDGMMRTFVVFQSLILIFYAFCCQYSTDAENEGRYGMYQDVHVMIFIGFGFLMTFLRKYGYSAVGLNFLISVIVIQFHPLLKQFWVNLFENHWHKVSFDIGTLINGDFAASTVLITFGALLGKTSPFQMIWIAILEPIFYSLNEEIGVKMGISDVGGSMVIHCFGAFFGLAASMILSPKRSKNSKNNAAVYHSDLFSMIGTIFLWMFWPSFNGAYTDGSLKTQTIVNTVLSLSASCYTAFVASYWLRGERKFVMVDIQNATLAGGVAMGTSANLNINPACAIAIGMSAGFVSVLGYTRILPWLEDRIGLHDTCGVLNLHGIPSIMGAIFGAIAANSTTDGKPGSQILFLLTTLGMSIVSGLLCGALLSNVRPAEKYFLDEEAWEVPEKETPYYFDEEGKQSQTERDSLLEIKSN